MNNLTIRMAGPDELERIGRLKEQIHQLHVDGRPDLFAPIADQSAFREYSQEKGIQLLLAELNGEAVGYALITLVDRPANPHMRAQRFMHVEEFCVDEACRHQKVGSALMDAVRQQASAQGCQRVVLDVWAFNEGAKQFYEAAGLHTYRYFMEMKTED